MVDPAEAADFSLQVRRLATQGIDTLLDLGRNRRREFEGQHFLIDGAELVTQRFHATGQTLESQQIKTDESIGALPQILGQETHGFQTTFKDRENGIALSSRG